MSRISRRLLDKDLENRMFEVFIKTLVDLKNFDDVKSFLNDLLSPIERLMLVKRLAIAILLTKGYTYEMIDEALKVSHPTIMKISFWLKYGSNKGYKSVIDRFLKEQKREESMDKIEEILFQLSRPKAYGSPAWERKSKKGKKLVRKRIRRSLL